jgi:hypothetical protein
LPNGIAQPTLSTKGRNTYVPHRYRTPPVPCEHLRCALARIAFWVSLRITSLGARLLPPHHPVKVYLDARVNVAENLLVRGAHPSSDAKRPKTATAVAALAALAIFAVELTELDLLSLIS